MGIQALVALVFGGVVFFQAGRMFSSKKLGRGNFAVWASMLFLGSITIRLFLGFYS